MTGPPIADLMDRALHHERLGQFDAARELLRQAISSGETPQTLDARVRLGKLLIYGGPRHSSEAEQVLSSARLQAEQAGASRQTASAIHLLALLELRRGNLERAQQLLEESPALKQAAAPGPTLGQWFHYRGLVEAERGEVNYAERLLFRAYQAYQEAHHEPGLAEVCDSLANLLLRRGKSRAALTFARRSLDLKRSLGDRHGEAIGLGTLGRAYLLLARYAEAAKTFAEDLAIARELGDERGVGIMLNSLGEVALLQKDLDAAAASYEQSLAEDRGSINAIHALLGLARANLAGGRIEDATTLCERMAALIEQHTPSPGLKHALDGLRGSIAWRGGDFSEGERLLALAIAGLRGQNFALDTIPWLYELRDLHQRQGKTAQAVAAMSQALDLLSECGAERGVEDVEEWLRTVDSPGLTRLALERHFPSWLVEDIVSGRLKRPASTKQEIAVLFSDVRDYTTLTEGLPPEEIVEILNEWFAEATRATRRQGGIVDKFIGDAVMALFGVPEPRADAAAAAVRTALEMRDALAALNLREKALGGKEIRVGIGIDSGEAVVGFIGSHLRQPYTAIGDPVNTASRLESATKNYPGCDILISQKAEVGQQRLGVAETCFVGHPELKGKGQKVAAYQVLGPRDPKAAP